MNTTCTIHANPSSFTSCAAAPRPARHCGPCRGSFLSRAAKAFAGMILCALLVFNGSTAAGQTHPFEASATGVAQFLYDGNTVDLTSLWAQPIHIKGFSKNATASINFDGAEPTGALTGFFYAFRTVGQGGKHSQAEHIFGSVSGTSVNVGTGMYYQGTITITHGTGRLEGVTGSISFEAFQYGFIDPVFVLTPNTVPMQITYSGSYTLPKGAGNE